MVALRQNSRHQELASQEESLEVPYNSWLFVYSLLPWIKAQPTDKTPLTSRAHSYSINFTFKTSGRKRVPSNSYSIEKWSNCHHLKTQGRHFEATVLNIRTHHFAVKAYENLFLLQMQVLALNCSFALCCQFTDTTCNAFTDSLFLQGLSKGKKTSLPEHYKYKIGFYYRKLGLSFEISHSSLYAKHLFLLTGSINVAKQPE